MLACLLACLLTLDRGHITRRLADLDDKLGAGIDDIVRPIIRVAPSG